MFMDEDILQLLKRYLLDELEAEQRQRLMRWVEEDRQNALFFDRFCQDRSFRERWEIRRKIDTLAAWQVFERRITRPHRRSYRWTAIAVAAAVSIFAVTTIVFFRKKISDDPIALVHTGIAPGSSKAVLIMADGKQVKLETTDSLRLDLGIAELLNKDEQLIYEGKETETLQYNELKIPRGGEYRVTLSDGTRVRLNSCSSLKYPVVFGKNKREVELKGEAFFEVAKSAVPFYVRMDGMKVKVYGTVFNVQGHRPDCIQTALVEGKIGISLEGSDQEYIVLPSQLAEWDRSSATISVRETDLTPYVAWTRGLFVFHNRSLEEIMTTLSLWYDIEVFYQSASLQELHFTGCVKRYDHIGRILNALSQSVGVKFNQKGKTLTISY